MLLCQTDGRVSAYKLHMLDREEHMRVNGEYTYWDQSTVAVRRARFLLYLFCWHDIISVLAAMPVTLLFPHLSRLMFCLCSHRTNCRQHILAILPSRIPEISQWWWCHSKQVYFLLPDVFIKDHSRNFVEREAERNVRACAHIDRRFDFIAVGS